MQWHPAVFGLVLAVCLGQAAASDSPAVKGEVSPQRATAAAAPKLRAAQIGALDTALAISLPPLNQQQRSSMTERRQGVGPLRIGFHRDLPGEYRGDLTPLLRWMNDPNDGSMVAAATVTSPGAVRVRLAIRADLPPRAKIRFFGGEPLLVVGVVDRSDLSHAPGQEGTDLLWSPSVPGDTIGLEITLPSGSARSETSVVIDRVSHQFRSFEPPPAPPANDGTGTSQIRSHLQCTQHVEIQCRDVGRLADAVAYISYEKGRNSYDCSGTLMNDDDIPGFLPYFLTAHHCVKTQSVAETVEAYWLYQFATCGGTHLDHRLTKTSGGADLLATSEAQDSTLLRFRSQAPGGLWLAGWTTSSLDSGESVYGIHHPGGHEKKYVAGITGRAIDFQPCADPQNPTSDTCYDVEKAIPINVTDGATVGGSSGSGLFIDDYLVGVLSGGVGCSDATYGRFSDFFPHVRRWLRPDPGRVGTVAVQPTSLQVPEGGENTYTLRLRGLRPSASVTIRTRISGDLDLWTDPASVTFSPEDWDSPQRITVYAKEDNDQSNGTAIISHTVTSYDVAYHGIRVATVTATEKDNDRRAGTVTGVSARTTGEPGELEISWNAVAGADGYIVEWRQPHQDFSPSRRQLVRGSSTSTTLVDLDGDTRYIVRVTATEEGLRDGNPSRTIEIATAEGTRPFLRGWRMGIFNAATTTPISSGP